MEIKRGWHRGTWICFYLCTVETGKVDDVGGIAIYDDDFTYIYPVIKKYCPEFDIYDLCNPIKQPACNQLAMELELIVSWMKTGVSASEISYYVEWLEKQKGMPAIEERIKFFEELIQYLWEQEERLGCDNFLNLEGF